MDKWLVIMTGGQKVIVRIAEGGVEYSSISSNLVTYYGRDADGVLIISGYLNHGTAYITNVNPYT